MRRTSSPELSRARTNSRSTNTPHWLFVLLRHGCPIVTKSAAAYSSPLQSLGTMSRLGALIAFAVWVSAVVVVNSVIVAAGSSDVAAAGQVAFSVAADATPTAFPHYWCVRWSSDHACGCSCVVVHPRCVVSSM